MQCTSAYPCPPEQVGLNVLAEMRARYGVPIGLLRPHARHRPRRSRRRRSAPTVIEKHFTFSRRCTAATRPTRWSRRSSSATGAGPARRSGRCWRIRSTRTIVAPYRDMKRIFEKSVVTARRAGRRHALIERGDLAFKKPGDGIPAARWRELVGRRLRARRRRPITSSPSKTSPERTRHRREEDLHRHRLARQLQQRSSRRCAAIAGASASSSCSWSSAPRRCSTATAQVVDLIERDGFSPVAQRPHADRGRDAGDHGEVDRPRACIELSTVFERLRPDVVLTVGDRFETMATTLAAAYMNIPIAHTMGGEVSGHDRREHPPRRHQVRPHPLPGEPRRARAHHPAGRAARARCICVGCPRIDLVAEILADGRATARRRHLRPRASARRSTCRSRSCSSRSIR